MSNLKDKHIKLIGGVSARMTSNQPVIFISVTGKNTYLWIGNNAEDDKGCYATLSGPKTLGKLAKGILEALKKQ
jgi:hypothetical protein